MAGSLTIPNTIGSQPGPNVLASLFDANWSTIANYVNVREVLAGALLARPSPGVAGRWYFATDSASGTLYFDTGAAWQAAAPGAGNVGGGPLVQGLLGGNNGSVPNTRFDCIADLVVMRSLATGLLTVKQSTGTLTCNFAAVGANGLDAGVQAANTWYHVYFIGTGTAVALIASLTAPIQGPILPTGYSYTAYAGAVYSDNSNNLRPTLFRGSEAYYTAQVSVLVNGVATSETAVSLAAVIPPNAQAALCSAEIVCPRDAAGVGDDRLELRVFTGVQLWAIAQTRDTFGSGSLRNQSDVAIPNVGQSVFYLTVRASSGGTPCFANLFALGYRVANGGA